MTDRKIEPCTLDPHQEALQELYDALNELVMLKDMSEANSIFMHLQYMNRNPIAWQKAKEVIQKYKSIKE